MSSFALLSPPLGIRNDGLHPNDAGYAAVAQCVAKAILTFFSNYTQNMLQ